MDRPTRPPEFTRRQEAAGSGAEFANGLRERVTALVVVGEHVHGGTGRGQQHRVTGPGEPPRLLDGLEHRTSVGPVEVDHGYFGRVSRQGFADQGAVAPMRTAPRSRFAAPATSSSKVAPLASPPAIHTIDS